MIIDKYAIKSALHVKTKLSNKFVKMDNEQLKNFFSLIESSKANKQLIKTLFEKYEYFEIHYVNS